MAVTVRLLPLLFPIHAEDLRRSDFQAVTFYDRDGMLLQEVLSTDSDRSVHVSLTSVSPYFTDAMIAAEDKNFFRHGGIDYPAVIRAMISNISSGEIVSGASTITLQLARLLHPRDRHLLNKIKEAFIAWQIEAGMTKEQILEEYVNRLPMGGNLYGIESGSRTYFGIPSTDLTLAQAAFLASIPNSPNRFNPYHHPNEVRQRQKIILERMAELHMISPERIEGVMKEDLLLKTPEASFLAPHFVFHLMESIPDTVHRVKTTLDMEHQKLITEQMNLVISRLKEYHVTNAAVILLDNLTGGILAYAGSADFFDTNIEGQYDGVQALRQPGSTLKPFLYMMALERGFTPATVISDIPTHYRMPTGIYSPQNYSDNFHGPVRLREALGNSLNVPAVRVLAKVGVTDFLERLKLYEFNSLDQDADYYGVGLVLGGGEVSLMELSRAYLCLARGGEFQPLNAVLELNGKVSTTSQSNKIISTPQNNYLITNILKDPYARTSEFGFNSILNLPFPCAVKTGTSHRFCDNWTVGFTTDYTLGVWVGNFNHTPMMKVSGVTGAGPLFASIMYLLSQGKSRPAEFPVPEGLTEVPVCPLSGMRPNPSCPSVITEIISVSQEDAYKNNECTMHFSEKTSVKTVVPGEFAPWAEKVGVEIRQVKQEQKLQIVHPLSGSVYYRLSNLAPRFQSVRMEAQLPGVSDAIHWYLNGKLIRITEKEHAFLWQAEPGSYQLEVRAEKSKEMRDNVRFQVK